MTMLHCVFAEDFSILYEVKLFILRSNLALNGENILESVFCELRKPNRLTFNRAYIKKCLSRYNELAISLFNEIFFSFFFLKHELEPFRLSYGINYS